MKKVLFIDRDGTLIREPDNDFQIDTLEKLEFIPGVFRNLYSICIKLNYELVMVSNQDGLGTDSYPEKDFYLVQDKMVKAFQNEGIIFNNILIDPSMPEDNAPTRKPRTALLTKYMQADYDITGSYVIGDRLTDAELASNLGCKAILLSENIKNDDIKKAGLEDTVIRVVDNWDKILDIVAYDMRVVSTGRKTNETEINVQLNLDGKGKDKIKTGLGFLDHMISQLARHSGIDLILEVRGDLQVDEHHTIEDAGIALGEAFNKALGNKMGIERYGFALPMDDCMARVLLDFGGRPWLVWDAEFKREKIGDVPTEMFMHFFKSFSDAAKCNLNVYAEGGNEHHKIEGIFKATAKAIKMAIKRYPFEYTLPSTKGKL